MKKGLVFIILCIPIVAHAAQLPAGGSKADKGILRVCVLKDAGNLTLSIKGRYIIFTLKTNEVIKEGRDLEGGDVLPTAKGLSISGEPFDIYGIKIVPRRWASIFIGGRSFRGSLDIIRTEDMKLLAVNHVYLEDYLKGVLYHEVSHWWPMETLKAQAIAARTYALYQRGISAGMDFDLTNDIYSQVYGGRASERFRTNRAVDLTRGRVLTFNNEIFPAYYHATCGGHTEDASNLWNIDIPVLKGVRCPFCRLSPHYNWKTKMKKGEVAAILRSAGYGINNLKAIKTNGRYRSGRVIELKIFSGTNETVMPAKDFRLLMGPNLIRSTNFRVEAKGDSFLFTGKGWGHGVGLCQWGAFFLGLKRYKAEDILRYYYPKSKIEELPSLL